MANVSLRQLAIRLGGKPILEDLDLDVVDGEFLVLLGPSGCGKSTLLHSIAGLIDVHAGSIVIGGEDMTWADPTDRNIGMVFQSYALYPTMNVERNMSFGLRIKGMPKAEIERRVGRAAEMLQLGPLLKRKPAELSGGQRQRVAIGRALVRDAGVFLFDEPLSNLDAKLRTELRRELKALHKSLGTTMVYVTHDQVEAMTLATRIAVMRAGKIQQIGTPAAVYGEPANLFVAGFLGAPSMNFVRGRLANGMLAPAFVAPELSIDVRAYPFKTPPLDEHAVVLGVRPEHVRIASEGEFGGTVALVEPMGNHQVVWIDCGGLQVSAIAHESLAIRPDNPVRFSIDAARVSLFDAATEERL